MDCRMIYYKHAVQYDTDDLVNDTSLINTPICCWELILQSLIRFEWNTSICGHFQGSISIVLNE